MSKLLKNGSLFLEGRFVPADLMITGKGVFVFRKDSEASVAGSVDPGTPSIDTSAPDANAIDIADPISETIDITDKAVLPGFADVHVHFREPGLSYKETIKTGAMAGTAGGYTCVCPMPNLDPAPSDYESLEKELEIIRRDALIDVIPYGTISRVKDGRRELSAMEEMAPYVVAFSDDGRGVQTGGLMRDAMQLAKTLGKLIVAHCEDESLLEPGGCIHAGRYAEANDLIGISSASEWKQVERDVNLADETGCGYHVCHVSTKESVEIIREAKKSGVNVTCETAPHYLTLTEEDLEDSGSFKMNPPLREIADKDAILEGVSDGTIDIIATDHAPHSAEEKSRGLERSPFGIVGLETAFPILYTKLVMGGTLSLDHLMELISGTPRRRFGLPGAESLSGGTFRPIKAESTGGGCEANVGYAEATSGMMKIWGDMTVIDLNNEFTIDPDSFQSMGRATPFAGWEVFGKVEMTMHNGEVVYRAHV